MKRKRISCGLLLLPVVLDVFICKFLDLRGALQFKAVNKAFGVRLAFTRVELWSLITPQERDIRLFFSHHCENMDTAKLFQRVEIPYEFAFGQACTRNDLRVLKWLRLLYPHEPLNWENFNNVCDSGFLEVAQWMTKEFNVGRLNVADRGYHHSGMVRDGHLPMVKWFHKYFFGVTRESDFETACAYGHIKIAKWLLAHLKKYARRTFINGFTLACANNHIDCSKWIHTEMSITSKEAKEGWGFAVSFGYVEILYWLDQTFQLANWRGKTIRMLQ
jgi:hypothetical protein